MTQEKIQKSVTNCYSIDIEIEKLEGEIEILWDKQRPEAWDLVRILNPKLIHNEDYKVIHCGDLYNLNFDIRTDVFDRNIIHLSATLKKLEFEVFGENSINPTINKSIGSMLEKDKLILDLRGRIEKLKSERKRVSNSIISLLRSSERMSFSGGVIGRRFGKTDEYVLISGRLYEIYATATFYDEGDDKSNKFKSGKVQIKIVDFEVSE